MQARWKLELEWVPDPAKRPRPKEKLAGNKPNTQNYLGPNLGQARELFDKLDKTRRQWDVLGSRKA